MKCITRRIILTMFVFMVLFGGCKKKEESILPSANNVQETTNKTENTKVSGRHKNRQRILGKEISEENSFNLGVYRIRKYK